MERLFYVYLALALLAGGIHADDLSANLSGGGGRQGLGSVITSGSTVTFQLFTNGIGNAGSASIRQGGNVVVNLTGSFSNGSATGSVNTAAGTVTAINNDPGAYTLQVDGSGGSVSGPLMLAGTGGTTPVPGTIGFLVTDVSIDEDAGIASINVSRTGGTAGAVTIDYATANGSAAAGSDYTAANGTLMWADGDSNPKFVDVPILTDMVNEPDETFVIDLSNPTGGATLGAAQVSVTIVNEFIPFDCTPSDTVLCLGDESQYQVTGMFDTAQGGGRSGPIRWIPTDSIGVDIGAIGHFGNASNPEFLVKVIDGCSTVFNSTWVFFAATTNFGFTLDVIDTQTGAMKAYVNPDQNRADAVTDTSALDNCP